jgi:hypothetical protein
MATTKGHAVVDIDWRSVMLARLLFAVVLLAHGAIHASFLAPQPPVAADGPRWPFELNRSWILTPLGVQPETTRLVGMAFAAATIATFALSALAAAGFIPAGLWVPASAVGAVTSLALLALFFDPWLVVGLLIDLALLWAVLIGWTPGGGSLT